MLRDAGVRTKLLAVLAIPTILLVVVTSLLVAGQVSQARRAGQVNALTDVAVQVNRVVHSLQAERSATLSYLQDQSEGNQQRMAGQRQVTDQKLGKLRDLVADSPVDQMSDAVGGAVARSVAGHGELGTARGSIDAGRFYATETDVFYAKIIRADLDLPGVIASSGTTELAQSLLAYEDLSSTIEYSAHERDLIEIALLSGSINEAEFAQTAALIAQQRQSLQDFQGSAPTHVFGRLQDALAGTDNAGIDRFRRSLSDLIVGEEPDINAAAEWVTAANSRVTAMTHAESVLVADIASTASVVQSGQERRALILVALALLGLGLALVLAVGLSRRITRPLRRLTAAAGDIGAELPQMVERMQTPGVGPGVVVEPIPVESSDEIGQLAAAFNTVNDVTVQVAKEQAALRASIAEMFVNVARRNQVLLGRQLKALDQMEAREEDPDVLQRLFTLDHLATRMRRNAESLLVLAGIDSTRRLRSALPLSDVIRTAVGEIEAFDRIDLSMAEDPDVAGRHALTVAHLLAELLENATHFSNPETRVVVSASVTGHGVDVTVTDYGLGMSEDELAEANEKIASPPIAEIAVSQRLGLFVVGRLAARLGSRVGLRRGRAAGTVVTASLPVALFEGLVLAVAPEPVLAEAVLAEPNPLVADADLPESGSDEQQSPNLAAPGTPADPPADTEKRGRLWTRWHPSSRGSGDAAPTAHPDPVLPAHAPFALPEPVTALVVEPEPFPAPAASPEPEPAPAAPAVYAAAVDVLPGRSQGGRFGRHRAPLPARREVGEPVIEPVVEPITEFAPLPARRQAAEPLPTAPMPTAPLPTAPMPVEPMPTAFAEPTTEPAQSPMFAAPRDVSPAPAPAAAPVAVPVPFVAPAPAIPPEIPPAPAPVAVPAQLAPPVPELPVQPMPAVPFLAGAELGARPDGPPAQAAAPVRQRTPEPAGAGALPGRAPVDPARRVSMAPAPSEDLERMSARSDLESAALAELRGLYEPAFAPSAPSAPAARPGSAAPAPALEQALVRRTRRTTPAAPAAAPAPAPAGRERTANDVRGMLSGFRAGVERGRTPAPHLPAASGAPANGADAANAVRSTDPAADPILEQRTTT